MKIGLIVALLVLVAMAGCRRQEARSSMGATDEGCCFASLDADGSTIVVKLRTASAAGIGEAVVRYSRKDPHYSNVQDHVGLVEVGKWKAVPPWPDTP